VHNYSSSKSVHSFFSPSLRPAPSPKVDAKQYRDGQRQRWLARAVPAGVRDRIIHTLLRQGVLSTPRRRTQMWPPIGSLQIGAENQSIMEP
uniref:Uncharacterized protein n=1 Tax=Aegilops tauschii subsp. strangulata TaxID=200361 RepID=A0A453CV13_AEGTS